MGIYNFKYNDVVRRLIKLGFIKKREAKGSHEIWMQEATKKIVTVPRHGSHTLSKGVIKSIIRTTGLSNEEFHKL